MNNRENFEWRKEHLPEIFKQTEEERIERLVDMLIQALYIPDKGEQIYHVDSNRTTFFQIDDSEPINWGDLKCNEVKRFDDGSFLVVIDEASPNNCPTFCGYIETYMASWGWTVRVETEF